MYIQIIKGILRDFFSFFTPSFFHLILKIDPRIIYTDRVLLKKNQRIWKKINRKHVTEFAILLSYFSY